MFSLLNGRRKLCGQNLKSEIRKKAAKHVESLVI